MRTDTSHNACLSQGALSKVGTVTPSCPTRSEVISRISIGPQRAQEPKRPEGRADPPYNCSASPYPGIDLADCTFTGSNLTGSNLTGADLAGANLIAVDIAGANLTGANLIGTNLIDDKTAPT